MPGESSSHSNSKGLTLVEVMVSIGIFSVIMLSLISTMVVSRRMTEAAIFQNATNSAVQGYMEQLKNVNYVDLTSAYSPAAGTSMSGSYATYAAPPATNYVINTLKNEDTTLADSLVVSPLPVIAPHSIVSGTIPSTVYDNVKTFNVNGTGDLTVHIWLWVQDITPSGVTPANQVTSITLVYTWVFMDGKKVHNVTASMSSIRSMVPTIPSLN